jgi:hypothetical protein
MTDGSSPASEAYRQRVDDVADRWLFCAAVANSVLWLREMINLVSELVPRDDELFDQLAAAKTSRRSPPTSKEES